MKERIDFKNKKNKLESLKKLEWLTLVEKIKREYERRLCALNETLNQLNIPKDSIVVLPPILNRVDFGYEFDIDLLFIGPEKQMQDLDKELKNFHNLFPSITHFSKEELVKLGNDLPELHKFISQKLGNISNDFKKNNDNSEDYLTKASKLEKQSRTIMSLEDKIKLKKERKEVAKNFISEVGKEITVLGSSISGSTVSDINKFSIGSDLDIELLVDELSYKDNLWIDFLKWKYADKFGVKVDIHDTELNSARKMIKLDCKFIGLYEKQFGIDIRNLQIKNNSHYD